MDYIMSVNHYANALLISCITISYLAYFMGYKKGKHDANKTYKNDKVPGKGT